MWADINGCRHYYEVAGEGKTVMTLHGGPGIGDHGDNKKMFSPLEGEYRFVYYDQRGNGQSDDGPEDTYTHDHLVADCDALRDVLGIERMALSGGSYGGMLAMEYALRHPDRLTHMILRGTSASHELQNTALENALKADLPDVNREMLENLFFGRMKDDDELRDTFYKIFPLYTKKFDPERTREVFARKRFRSRTHNIVFSRIFPAYDIRDRLGEIEVPTLILAGRHDWITPLKYAQELADGLINVRLVIFENAGHSINADAPEPFRAMTREFLNGPGPTGREVVSV